MYTLKTLVRSARLVLVLAGVMSFFVAAVAQATDATKLDSPISSQLAHSLRQAGHKGLSVRIKPSANLLHAISGPSVIQGNPSAGGQKKIGVLYIGADYCPYCAAERWPLALALMRFGHFHGLRYMRSSSSDVDANTVTFTFHGATYTSPYIVFQGVELTNRDRKRLEQPTKHQVGLITKYDAEPYTPHPDAIPFLYLAGHYVQSGSPFRPSALNGLNWQQVAQKIANPKTKLGHTIIGITNLYTAAVCRITKGKPKNVCQAPGVETAAASLP